MSNPYEITLNRAWTEWAITCGVSEAVAAALFLISESRALHPILAKLTPAEFEQVANIVERSADRFPLGTLAALKDWRAAATLSTDAPPNRAGRSSFATERLRPNRSRGFGRFRAGAPQGATEKSGTGAGTHPGTRAQTAQRRFEVAKLMKLGLSVRTISAGTGIPATSVHRAMRAIARADAKREAAVIETMRKILGKKLS